jgi:tetratricopeptide (TPR) repeat protein
VRRLRQGDEPPGPAGVRTYDELADRLRALRSWAGISYRELHRRVVRSRRGRGIAERPAFDTVHRCLQPGRRRLDPELVVEIAAALLGESPDQHVEARTQEWRRACQRLVGRSDDAGVVDTFDVLPDDIAAFTGRDAELDQLLDAPQSTAHEADADGTRPASVTCLIHGLAGVGKTSLAVRAAHRLLARWHASDVRPVVLVVNLRGYDPERPPADPLAVLDGFLRQLGTPGNQIHRLDLAGRTSKLGELLTGRRALLLLDNAADEEQVRPLLPRSGSCVVLVTSRRQLDGLPAARQVALEVFRPPEALELMRRGVGADRVDTDRSAAAEIARLVGHLPLAVGLVVARIRASPDWTLADHLERLAERRARLRLDDGVEVALASSYDALLAEHRRILRLLAVHPGHDFDAYAACALTDADLRTTVDRLGDLCVRSLLSMRGPGRYELHDLVRVFAANRLADEDRPGDRQAAATRLMDHYARTAGVAMAQHAPHEHRRFRAVVERAERSRAPVAALEDRSAAVAWLDAERVNLIALALQAAAHDDASPAGRLAVLLFPYLHNAGHNSDAEILLDCASGTSERGLQAEVLVDRAVLGIRLGRHRQAVDHLQRALIACRAVGDRATERAAEITLGRLYWQLGDYATAAEHTQRSLDLARRLGDLFGAAQGLGNLGLVAMRQGRYDAARVHLEAALATARGLPDDPRLEMNALANLADLHSIQGRHDTSVELLRQALTIAHETRYPPREAVVLRSLGAVYVRSGAPETALAHLREALRIARDCGDQVTVVEALNAVGDALRGVGRPDDAANRHREALAAASGSGLRYEQANALDGIAHALAGAGDVDAARVYWQDALVLHRTLGTPAAEEITCHLAELSPG